MSCSSWQATEPFASPLEINWGSPSRVTIRTAPTYLCTSRLSIKPRASTSWITALAMSWTSRARCLMYLIKVAVKKPSSGSSLLGWQPKNINMRQRTLRPSTSRSLAVARVCHCLDKATDGRNAGSFVKRSNLVRQLAKMHTSVVWSESLSRWMNDSNDMSSSRLLEFDGHIKIIPSSS